MSDNSYLGEIKAAAIPYEHEGWMFCDGRSLSIRQYGALYAVIGTRYGGDTSGGLGGSFNIPDLRGLNPLGAGTRGDLLYPLAATGGAPAFSSRKEITSVPSHTHGAKFIPDRLEPMRVQVSKTVGGASTQNPDGACLAVATTSSGTQVYAYKDAVSMSAAFLGGVTGGDGAGYRSGSVTLAQTGVNAESAPALSLELDIRQPYLALYFFICVDGQFP